ncbi:hypothetical protein ERC79_13145 [Rhodococcus sp. ABRD24]|uniref:hypothetical protein n=1 Tax=Rhodococcus sp. ABRD24 TaxID=2507582 RepID=UPI00103D75D5|nr:hypothetical protein [Rhodococcus sp. ABRD24]QBJ96796.1 hypothetical protein ERC79_13145 [Rhodococcus sp. ABRD24]
MSAIRLTRDLAQWAYTAVGEDERPNYSGIRYMSKQGEYECWAVFEGTGVQKESVRTIEWSDEDLQHVGRIFNLTVH